MFTGKRTKRLETYVTPEAKLALHEMAERHGCHLSTYLAHILSTHAASLAHLVSDSQPDSQPLTTTLRPVSRDAA